MVGLWPEQHPTPSALLRTPYGVCYTEDKATAYVCLLHSTILTSGTNPAAARYIPYEKTLPLLILHGRQGFREKRKQILKRKKEKKKKPNFNITVAITNSYHESHTVLRSYLFARYAPAVRKIEGPEARAKVGREGEEENGQRTT